MKDLNWNGIQISSMEELRRHFDLSEAMKTFLDGSLEKWLSDRYYDPQADELSRLGRNESDANVRAVCEVLGVSYPGPQSVKLGERERSERNLAIIRRYTDDEEALANADALAVDQNALAELLDAGNTIICLCAGDFTVPIRKKEIRYLLVGNPILNEAYTQEQYSDAGIEFVNVPSKVASENYGAGSNSLADFLHTAMETDRVQKKLEITINECGDHTYRSRSEAKHVAEEIFTSTYKQAASYFDPNLDDCIAVKAAAEYANTLREKMSAVMNILKGYDETRSEVQQIDDLISGAESELRGQFLKNLAQNVDFYQLYHESYFQSRIRVKEVSAYSDPLMDIADAIEKGVNGFFDGITGALERLQDWLDDTDDDDGEVVDEENEDEDIETGPEYFIDGLDSALEELQEDVDSRANAFYAAAYEQYIAYCEKIELLAESIDLPEDVLTSIEETL